MTIPVLLLFADTGGGHLGAAQAVADALDAEYPGVFAPSLYDPLRTWRSPRLLRDVAGLYGPIVRFAPWAWGAVYHASDSRAAADLLRRTWMRLADAPVAEVVKARQPAAVLSFHPLTTAPAVRAVRRYAQGTPVVTVVTDLVTPHATWRYDAVERIVVPSAAVRRRCEADGITPERCLDLGLPVGTAFRAAPLSPHQQQALRQRLGVDPSRFLVVVAGGGEGSGPVTRSAAAVTAAFDDVDVVAICGRNRPLQRQLDRLTFPGGSRLIVKGFVDNMADWYRAADVVVTKAGPQTIAEANCCGAALLVTAHLPGQERGNTELVTHAGAGLYTPRAGDLVAAIARLKDNPNTLQAMRRSALALARPGAARQVAALVARLTSPPAAGVKAARVVGRGAA
jgi:1,2-diacylglycerol 3-beta-galactosyltransferase